MLIRPVRQEGTRPITNIAFNLNTLAFIPVLGMSIAVSRLSGGGSAKAGRMSRRVGPKGFVISGGYMLMFGLIYVLLPDLLTRPYALRANPADAVPFSRFITSSWFCCGSWRCIRSLTPWRSFSVPRAAARGYGVFSMLFTLVSSMSLLVLPTFVTWLNYRNDPNLIWWSWVFCSVYVITLGVVSISGSCRGNGKPCA